MKAIGRLFLQGLVAVLPIAVTIYILYWLATSAEAVLAPIIKLVLGPERYLPGLGVAAGFVIVCGIGLLLHAWFVRSLFQLSEKILQSIPLVKTLYGSIRDLMSYFEYSKKKQFNQVVMVNLPDEQTRLIGMVTRDDFSGLPDVAGSQEVVAVYLPMSYQMGGFTVFVPRSKVRSVHMSVEEAMRFALTAAMSTEKSKGDQEAPK